MSEDAPVRDSQNPWVWTAVALAVGVLCFANFAPDRRGEVKPTGWKLGSGRTGVADGIPSSTDVPDSLQGKYR
jgi:hypothetical protein